MRPKSRRRVSSRHGVIGQRMVHLGPFCDGTRLGGVLPSSYSSQACPIARSLEVVGERWTLLILRDAFLGVRRFDDFRARLEVSRAVLARRLAALVEAGLLRRERY